LLSFQQSINTPHYTIKFRRLILTGGIHLTDNIMAGGY
jgi:hypothetical protein